LFESMLSPPMCRLPTGIIAWRLPAFSKFP
jgi:hypothetical protein